MVSLLILRNTKIVCIFAKTSTDLYDPVRDNGGSSWNDDKRRSY